MVILTVRYVCWSSVGITPTYSSLCQLCGRSLLPKDLSSTGSTGGSCIIESSKPSIITALGHERSCHSSNRDMEQVGESLQTISFWKKMKQGTGMSGRISMDWFLPEE
ncbi:hypothetical protein BRADI_2g05195v3 [Brachypodium distachyon]|uniref:Uncharacterized protein n=1 Tax=Brachypodium distachyon TaxID=15368 RepID=A0A0Q3FUG0_BRADI|nr:hypothetical protein BRADI_2g05195v3 [Brachypodium distachyon]